MNAKKIHKLSHPTAPQSGSNTQNKCAAYSEMPTLPSVSRSATSPKATVDAKVAKNINSTAATVLLFKPSTISVRYDTRASEPFAD